MLHASHAPQTQRQASQDLCQLWTASVQEASMVVFSAQTQLLALAKDAKLANTKQHQRYLQRRNISATIAPQIQAQDLTAKMALSVGTHAIQETQSANNASA